MEDGKRDNHGFYKKIALAAALTFFVFFGVGFSLYKTYIAQDKEVKNLKGQVTELTDFISKIKDQIGLFTASTTEIKNQTFEEIEKLKEEVEKQKESADKTVSGKLPSDLITTIMKRTVFVYCKGPKGAWRGSGTTQLFWYENPIAATNYHIADVGKPEEVRCEIHLPLPPEYSTYGKAFLAKIGKYDPNYPAIDAAILNIQDVSESEKKEYFSSFPVEFCRTEDINVGNAVTLFGYPKFGVNTLTVTDGVISGILKTDWGPKYKTSAKMDLGNSGGVAVDNKNKCVIGMPTWTQYGGEIGDLIKTGESLGQIQSWEMIVTSGGLFK